MPRFPKVQDAEEIEECGLSVGGMEIPSQTLKAWTVIAARCYPETAVSQATDLE